MVSLYNNHLNGILADEMGLGKTVQVTLEVVQVTLGMAGQVTLGKAGQVTLGKAVQVALGRAVQVTLQLVIWLG